MPMFSRDDIISTGLYVADIFTKQGNPKKSPLQPTIAPPLEAAHECKPSPTRAIKGRTKSRGNKKYADHDPLKIIILSICTVLFIIYFANDFLCRMVGLYVPAYYVVKFLATDTNANKRNKIYSMAKYYFVYAHIDLCASILALIGLHLHIIKFVLLLFCLYASIYNYKLMDNLYNYILDCDVIFFAKLVDKYNDAMCIYNNTT